MKIKNLEDYVGQMVFFCNDEPRNGNGDVFCEYFTGATEALTFAESEYGHLTDREKAKRIISVCSGIVSDDGIVNDYDTIKDFNRLWYAVVSDLCNGWGTGSFDLEEAKRMCHNSDDDYYLAVIDDGIDPVCIGTIKREDI